MMSLRLHKDLGAHLLASGKLSAALSAFRQAVAAAPDEPGPRQKVAEILVRLGQTEAAVAAYSETIDRYCRQGQEQKAVALCRILLTLEPGHAVARQMVAAG